MATVFRMDNRFGKTHKEEWLTPPEIIRALGRFDLDPCAPIIRPWPTADQHYTIADDGLKQQWTGRVWMNPPFGAKARVWLKKLADHGNGIALIAARTETRAFYESVWMRADAVLFLIGRPHFHHVNGERASANSGAPICLVAYGKQNVVALRESGLWGHLDEFSQENIVV
ncbi:MAG TPA: DNA N-6-adenine-methyltransferase [Pyrinomonadaceae bacterium]|nr:DNA N-6-adenine-methyltransferase [Pyrinomonadaceae bacterium]